MNSPASRRLRSRVTNAWPVAGGGVRRVERPVAGAVVGVVVRHPGARGRPTGSTWPSGTQAYAAAAAARRSSRAPSRSTSASTRPRRRRPTAGSGRGGSSASSGGTSSGCPRRARRAEVATPSTSGSREAIAPTLSSAGPVDARPAEQGDPQLPRPARSAASTLPGVDVDVGQVVALAGDGGPLAGSGRRRPSGRGRPSSSGCRAGAAADRRPRPGCRPGWRRPRTRSAR